jgi:CRP/FNR family cyclic AMP-dependent transcriptional regulator
MNVLKKTAFDSATYLASASLERRIVRFESKSAFFLQGSRADCVFYLQTGRAKLTVVSKRGKEATVSLLSAGDFVGEESITAANALHLATATAITPCVTLKIDKAEMLRVLHEEQVFSDFFLKFMLVRGLRTQADLVDQLFNSTENRLARTMLLMAKYDASGESETLIPSITQETLAEMIGTTRSRVSFFINRFRKQSIIRDAFGFISLYSRLFCKMVYLRETHPSPKSSIPHGARRVLKDRPDLSEPQHSLKVSRRTKVVHKSFSKYDSIVAFSKIFGKVRSVRLC